MSFLNKLGIGIGVGSETSRDISRPAVSGGRARTPGGTAATAGAGPARAPDPRESTRVSNGLKEFLWNLDGLGRGTLLDLGPAWQTTLSFFIERGFRVSSEDILRGWKAFLMEEEARLREDAAARESLDMTANGRAKRFLAENLQYPRASFDAVLLWDLLDYLEPVLVKQIVATLTELLPRDPRPVRALSDNEIVRGPRSIARNSIHQVNQHRQSSGFKRFCVNRRFTNSPLASNEPKEYKEGVSSESSGGIMTPPGLELHHS